MASTEKVSNTQPEQAFSNILVQVHFDDPQEVAKKETGLKLAKEIYRQQWSNNTDYNFFAARAAHQVELEKWSLGKQDMMQFLSFMGVNDANKSEANIDMTPIMVGAQFTGTLVTSIARNQEYPCVKAVDINSQNEKIDRMMEAVFRMKEVETINQAQQAAGFQLEPSNAYVPDTELAAKVYFEQKDQLPKEIKFQKILNEAMLDNQYERVLKPRLIRNNVVFNMEVLKVGRGKGSCAYNMEVCIPKTVFYNYFIGDSGREELAYIGRGYNLKVRDIRKEFGKTDSNPKGLTEEEIYKFAKLSAQNYPVTPLGFNHAWGQQYTYYQGNVPWDDFSGFVIDFEIKISESKYWVSSIDNSGKENIAPKKGIPTPQSEKSKIIKKDEDVIYRCVYAPYANMILYWGNAELKDQFSYSINIPYNNGEYVPSLFERALEPLKRLALIVMKEKLLISRLSPTGFRIDVESAKNIVTGNGRVYEWEDIVRIKTITGIELYSSKGLNPLEPSAPAISTASQDPTLQNIIQLDQTRIQIIQEIRDLLGVPIYLDGSNVGQRTAGKLAEGQREATSNVTGFIQNSHNQVVEEALNKICLMAWQDVVTTEPESDEDLINTKFKTFVKMKITDEEKQLLEQDIARWSVPQPNGKPLLSPADVYAIRNIDDYKLAEMYLIDKIEENERKQIAESERLQQQNAQVQEQSATLAAQQAKQLQDEKLAAEKEIEQFRSKNKKEEIFLQGYLAAAAKDESGNLLKQFLPVVQQLIPNLVIPIAAETQQMQNEIAAAEQQEAMQQQMAAQQQQVPEEQMEQGMQQNPQEEMMEQQPVIQ
jgi:hypothetical protein